MTPTNSFKTNDEYYERLFGRRDTPEKNSNAQTMIDNASQNIGPDFPYSIIPSEFHAKTYGLALEKLRNSRKNIDPKHLITIEGKKYIRPLTFKETIEAKLNAYESGTNDEEKNLLFNYNIATCTGVAYPSSDSKNVKVFKIIPICKELITLDSAFKESSLKIPYNSLEGIELDITKGRYGKLLTISDFKNHPAWIAALEEDRHLLNEYANLAFSLSKHKVADSWSKNSLLPTSQLTVLAIVGPYGVDSSYILDGHACLVRISYKKSTKRKTHIKKLK